MNQSSTEVSRIMYLSSSSLLYHFIKCSTCCSQVSYLLQPNLLPNIKSKKPPSAFSSSKKSLFIGVSGWRHSWRRKCMPPAHFCPHGESIYPAWWIYRARRWTYRSTIVSIYTHHAEYIPLPVSPKSWMRWKHSPLFTVYSRAGVFSAFSRYRLPARRLRIKLKRLKPDYSIKNQ